MAGSILRMRVLILAAYILAAILPVLASADSRQRSMVDHEQMMAMGGHLPQMPASDSSADDAQLMLCQQHCILAAGPLPGANGVVEAVARFADVSFGNDLLAALLAIPPPGPPPKLPLI